MGSLIPGEGKQGKFDTCQKLAPVARWFAAVLNVPYVLPECIWGLTEKEAAQTQLGSVQNGSEKTPLVELVSEIDCDENTNVFDEIELFVFGIVCWKPGQRVEFHQQGTRLSELVSRGASASAIVFVGGFFLLGLLGRFSGEDSGNGEIIGLMTISVLACALAIFYGYEPTRISILDWSRRSVILEAGQDSLLASFNEIAELQSVGEYTPERTTSSGKNQTSQTYPVSWETWLNLSLKNGQSIRIADGNKISADAEESDPSHRSYEELMPIAEVLAEAIGVPWSWSGFEGHESFQPHVVEFGGPKKVAANRELESAKAAMARAKFSQVVDGDSDDELRQAISHLNRASESDPSNVEPYLEAAKICEHRDDHRSAITFYSAVLDIDRAHIESYRSRGRHFALVGEPFELGASSAHKTNDFLNLAVLDFSKAIELDETHRDYEARGRVYQAARQYEEAVDDFTKCLEIQSTSSFFNREEKQFSISITLGYRAEVFCKRKNWKQASDDIERAIQIHPKSMAWNGELRSDIRAALGG